MSSTVSYPAAVPSGSAAADGATTHSSSPAAAQRQDVNTKGNVINIRLPRISGYAAATAAAAAAREAAERNAIEKMDNDVRAIGTAPASVAAASAVATGRSKKPSKVASAVKKWKTAVKPEPRVQKIKCVPRRFCGYGGYYNY